MESELDFVLFGEEEPLINDGAMVVNKSQLWKLFNQRLSKMLQLRQKQNQEESDLNSSEKECENKIMIDQVMIEEEEVKVSTDEMIDKFLEQNRSLKDKLRKLEAELSLSRKEEQKLSNEQPTDPIAGSNDETEKSHLNKSEEDLKSLASSSDSDDDFVVIKSKSKKARELAMKGIKEFFKIRMVDDKKQENEKEKGKEKKQLELEEELMKSGKKLKQMEDEIQSLKEQLESKEEQVKTRDDEMEKIKEENLNLKELLEKRNAEIISLNCNMIEQKRLNNEMRMKSNILIGKEKMKNKEEILRSVTIEISKLKSENKSLREQREELSQRLNSSAEDYRQLAKKNRKLEVKINEFKKESIYNDILIRMIIDDKSEEKKSDKKSDKEDEGEQKNDKEVEKENAKSENNQNQAQDQPLNDSTEPIEEVFEEINEKLDEWIVKCESEEKQTEEKPLIGSTEQPQETVEENKFDGEENLTETKSQDIRQTTELIEWKPAANGEVGPDAVAGGNERDGRHITFVGRALVDGRFVPGKIVQKHHECCYVIDNGEELKFTEYEYLVKPSFGTLVWKPASNGRVPTGAIVGGKTAEGEPLFVGRANFEDNLIICKLQPSHFLIQFPWFSVDTLGTTVVESDESSSERRTINISQYEVLCHVFD